MKVRELDMQKTDTASIKSCTLQFDGILHMGI